MITYDLNSTLCFLTPCLDSQHIVCGFALFIPDLEIITEKSGPGACNWMCFLIGILCKRYIDRQSESGVQIR